MKKYLLPQKGDYYKANLHCHSTLSDGRRSVEELKEIYKNKGYAVLAYSDHDKYYNHKDLCDEKFIAINSFEVDISEPRTKTNNHIKCYHLNCFDTDSNRKGEYILPKYPAYSDKEGINKFIKQLNDDGFLVCYNHPHWSLQNLDDYRDLEGLFALEVYNHASYLGGIAEEQTHAFDDFLRMNKRIFCVAADDNHDNRELTDPTCQSFGGFIMIKSESFDHESIMNAMKEGNFYASRGPLIEELYIEDSEIHIKCSSARTVSVCIAGRNARRKIVGDDEILTEATFTINPQDDVFFRLEVTDHKGYKAYTNAFFFDDLGY